MIQLDKAEKKIKPTHYDAKSLVDIKNMGILEMAPWLSLYDIYKCIYTHRRVEREYYLVNVRIVG